MSDDSEATGDEPKPDESTGLPEDWRERAVTALNLKVPGSGQCIRCRTGTVTIAPDPVTPMVFERAGGITIGGRSYPQIMVVCGNCGHTSYFNLIALGAVTGQSDEGGHG